MNFYEYFHNRRLEVLRGMLGGRGFSSALDVGASEGMLRMTGLGWAVGVDIKRGLGVTILASAEDLPLRAGVFELVFAGEVLEHLSDPGRGLTEWVRVLMPNGTLILSTPNGILVSPFEGNPEHKAIYAPDDITRALQARGLTKTGSRGIYTGLVSGNRLFRLIPLGWAKKWLLRVPVPLYFSYDIVLMARKEPSAAAPSPTDSSLRE